MRATATQVDGGGLYQPAMGAGDAGDTVQEATAPIRTVPQGGACKGLNQQRLYQYIPSPEGVLGKHLPEGLQEDIVPVTRQSQTF
jgi:hypothetical protein